jgi:hypothetical protein
VRFYLGKGLIMASQEESVQENEKSGGIVSTVASVVTGAGSILGKMWDAVMADGMIAAAGRQGIDELGAALQAFPDSIQVQEAGTIWNPTQGEIAADRDLGRPMWPSVIAQANRANPAGLDQGKDTGIEPDTGYSM